MPSLFSKIIIITCLFFSGAAALTYEVLWIKLMGLFVGNSHWAYAAVVAGFMGGLAVGNFAGGRIVKRLNGSGLLSAYALIEAGTALGGLATYYVSKIVQQSLLGSVIELPFAIQPYIWFTISFIIVLIPSAFIGAVFPIISQWYAGTGGEQTARKLAVLYAVNTAGAASGIIAAGFFLARYFGLARSFFTASSVNLLCAAAAFAVFMIEKDSAQGEAKKIEYSKTDADVIAVPAFFLAGAASMICQIVWTRLLILFIGSSTYAYSVILLVFIAGLSAGSAVFSRFGKLFKPDFWAAGICYGLLSAFIVISMYYTEYLPYIYVRILPMAAQNILPIEVLYVVVCSAMIFLPTFFMGAAYPLFLSAAAANNRVVGENVGIYTGINTVGSIGGITAAVFVIIPNLGIEAGLMIAGLSYAIVSVVLIFNSGRRNKVLLAGGIIIFSLITNVLRKPWDVPILSSGVFVYAPEYWGIKTFRDFKLFAGRNDILYHKDGNSATVTVLHSRTNERFMRINGKTDASWEMDMNTQLLLAHLPRFFYKGCPEEVMIVGLGSGSTAGAVSLDECVKNIDCVEMESAVAEAAVLFNDVNRRVLDDPRLNLIYTDARHYLSGTKKKYDIIISEPSNPWISGISALYTLEAFTMVSERLNEGGIFAQWLHSYSMSEQDFKMICATFLEVFPNALLFSPKQNDYILLGSHKPFVFDFQKVERFILENPGVAEDLSLCEIPNTFVMLAVTFSISGEDLREFVSGSPVLRDDKITLEYSAPRNLYGGDAKQIEKNIFEARDKSIMENIIGLDISSLERVLLYNQTGEAFLRRRDSVSAHIWFLAADEIKSDDARTLTNLGRIASLKNQDMQAERFYKRAIEADKKYAMAYFHLGQLYVQQGMEEKGRPYLEKGLEYSPDDPFAVMSLGRLYMRQGKLEMAKHLFEKALESWENMHPIVRAELEKALKEFESAKRR